ncbi:MAG: hypothetical protein N4A33_08485 [Bacteriovoracaceae bacterium]|jgi:hypothetical protein|nr:hypothetical protein [Bacteriovoracaceae bacterium]
MKKLLIGLLALGSISSYADCDLSASNNSLIDSENSILLIKKSSDIDEIRTELESINRNLKAVIKKCEGKAFLLNADLNYPQYQTIRTDGLTIEQMKNYSKRVLKSQVRDAKKSLKTSVCEWRMRRTSYSGNDYRLNISLKECRKKVARAFGVEEAYYNGKDGKTIIVH